MPRPPKPTAPVIRKYLKKWKTLEKYRLQEDSLNLLFQKLCPENKRIDHVLLKVSALNDFYSTNIYATYPVAKHILSKKIDRWLKAGDCSLVNEIAEVSVKKGIKKNFYSFASKYCSHHQPNIYPIYDSYVERMLMHFKRSDGFDHFTKADLKNYKRFVEVIENFKIAYGLKRFSLREIDIFLWIAGKESFPRKYF